jgi:hypothetical protein
MSISSDTLQVAIDVSGDGKLPWPPSTQSSNAPTLFHNITIFLTSYTTLLNLTISNGSTVPTGNTAYVGPVLSLEPTSTVKHVNWVWPACLVGNGDGSPRGAYNISLHQSFRWNGTDYYTVFDLPISVTNSISNDSTTERVNCAEIENPVLNVSQIANSCDTLAGSPWITTNSTPGSLTAPGSGGVSTGGSGSGSGSTGGSLTSLPKSSSIRTVTESNGLMMVVTIIALLTPSSLFFLFL